MDGVGLFGLKVDLAAVLRQVGCGGDTRTDENVFGGDVADSAKSLRTLVNKCVFPTSRLVRQSPEFLVSVVCLALQRFNCLNNLIMINCCEVGFI